MNYRHAFHAGNFADVHKHSVLVRVLLHLRLKPAAFRVIDTHAGSGRYDLCGSEATRSGEWHQGIERIWRAREAEAGAQDLIKPYLDVVAALNPGGELRTYPGSPLIAQSLLRAQDRLIACELEPGSARALCDNLAGRPACQGADDRRLDGCGRLRSAAGAARARSDRSAFRGGGRFHAFVQYSRRWPTENGQPASISSGTQSRTGRLPTHWPGGFESCRCPISCVPS